jgi:CubicO group peptidase (beta-lactamase class C family)
MLKMTHRVAGLVAALALMRSAPIHAQAAAQPAPPPTAVRTALAAAFPEIQRIAESFVERAHVPGAAVGVIVNGELVWETGIGVRDRATNAPARPESIFRIASMTKSFTAAAILKLRDEGRLSLDAPAEEYVPELKTLSYPTKDSPRITVRHLLSHAEGFPEDNPWGDRQLARTDALMSEWMRRGIPFSTSPGTAYEYSNYGFAILGQIVARVSGQPYEKYLQANILDPLGMTSTTFDVGEVPKDRIAKGYRWIDQRWEEEELLPHGSFGAMGGLWTSTRDLAKWVAFLLDGFPPRDDVERGPLRRSSVREMQQVWRSTRGTAIPSSIDVAPALNAGGYGYGLRITQNCAFGHLVAHGGGLPGYGSQMQWLPDYGVGIIAMGNVTYTGWGGAVNEMWSALLKTGALVPRRATPSALLLDQQRAVSSLIGRWDDRLAATMAADNLFMDESAASRRTRLHQLAEKHGVCRPSDTIDAENALRGSWRMACDRGRLDVSITLAPTMPPSVQYWSVRSVLPPSQALTAKAADFTDLISRWDDQRARSLLTGDVDLARLRRQSELVRAQHGACRVAEQIDGDGALRTTVRLACDRGALTASLAVDPRSGVINHASLSPVIEGACVAK